MECVHVDLCSIPRFLWTPIQYQYVGNWQGFFHKNNFVASIKIILRSEIWEHLYDLTEGEVRMNNPETLSTLTNQDLGRRRKKNTNKIQTDKETKKNKKQTKQETNQKTKKKRNTDPTRK